MVKSIARNVQDNKMGSDPISRCFEGLTTRRVCCYYMNFSAVDR